ncbi:hypothetical protein [Marinifilum caeruleilacunae]|nr:hypothetical protein [Marinifilum caeruleilacunae]
MKRKKIMLNESNLLSRDEEMQIRGGKKRARLRMEDGTKIKVVMK